MLLRYKMMPPAGTSPLILLGLQWWPLNPPGGVCPGSASAYRLDEAWVGGSAERSFFDPDTWSFWHGTADPTGGPTQYVDHATALANGMLEEGDGWAVMRAGKPVRPETSDLVPATFQAAESPQITLTLTLTLTLPLPLTLPPTLTHTLTRHTALPTAPPPPRGVAQWAAYATRGLGPIPNPARHLYTTRGLEPRTHRSPDKPLPLTRLSLALDRCAPRALVRARRPTLPSAEP